MKDKLSKVGPVAPEDGLVRSLRKVWLSVSGETLDNTVCGMLEGMREGVK